jgi:hypothetical protein
MDNKIVFNDSAKEMILSAIGMKVKKGKVFDQKGKAAYDSAGNRVTLENFAGAFTKNGEVHFLTDDILSIFDYVETKA